MGREVLVSSFAGLTIGRYHVIEQLGEGGMATVYKALDTRLDRLVAIKVIRLKGIGNEDLPSFTKRFEREAKVLARLSHPNIVKVLDYGEYEGAPYLVMEYLPGGTLKEYVGRPMPVSNAMRFLLPVAGALAYAHQHALIHRDIKPSNILITESGAPMLADFGVAKILQDDSDSTSLTRIGVGVGTPAYMAPEQWTNQVVPQTDMYALGVVLYELVTGRRPYDADTPAAVFLKQMQDPLPRPRDLVPDLPAKVEQVLFRALAREPENRYADMNAFLLDLEELASLREKGRPRSRASRTKVPITRAPSGPRLADRPARTLTGKQKASRVWMFLFIALAIAFAGVLAVLGILGSQRVREQALAAQGTTTAQARLAQGTTAAQARVARETTTAQAMLTLEAATAQAQKAFARETEVIGTAQANAALNARAELLATQQAQATGTAQSSASETVQVATQLAYATKTAEAATAASRAQASATQQARLTTTAQAMAAATARINATVDALAGLKPPCHEMLYKVQVWSGELRQACDPQSRTPETVALKLTALPGSIVEVYSALIPVQPNQAYQVSYWVKTDLEVSGAELYGKVVPSQYSAQAQETDGLRDNRLDSGFALGESVGGKTAWAFKSYSFTTHPDAAFVRLRATIGGPDGTAQGTMWLEQVRIALQ
jgi:tRNA A-37 threonylcarbamoyl transferase component Bud32